MCAILDHTTILSPDCTAASILHGMEVAARLHTDRLGVGRAQMQSKYGLLWMVVRGIVRLSDAPDTAVPLTVRTWHRGVSHGVVYRDFDLLQNGKLLGEAAQIWVLVDEAKRCLYRADKCPALLNVPQPEHIKTLCPRKLSPPPTLLQTSPICPGTDATDDNGHINNAAYVALALRSLPKPITALRTLELCYQHECFAGQSLPRFVWQADGQSYVRLCTPDGTPAFELLATEK